MQIKLFTVPVLYPDSAEAELNRFLAGKRILTIEQQLTTQDGGAFWCFCVRYLEKTATNKSFRKSKADKIDYKEELDAATFGRFSLLRAIRKELAKEDAVPAFAVFTDAELAAIAGLAELTPQQLQTIKGVGEKKVSRYGERLIQAFKAQTNGTP